MQILLQKSEVNLSDIETITVWKETPAKWADTSMHVWKSCSDGWTEKSQKRSMKWGLFYKWIKQNEIKAINVAVQNNQGDSVVFG